MLVAKVVEAVGWIVQFEVEQIIAGSLGTAASVLYVAGRAFPPARGISIVLALLSAAANWYLPSLQPKYPTSGYGSHRADAPRPLLSPQQPKRQELYANRGPWFRDDHGRRVLLRGVNLAGSSKYPLHAPTHKAENFYDTSNISFVGRPFPLAEVRNARQLESADDISVQRDF
jgi:hypothetical protein